MCGDSRGVLCPTAPSVAVPVAEASLCHMNIAVPLRPMPFKYPVLLITRLTTDSSDGGLASPGYVRNRGSSKSMELLVNEYFAISGERAGHTPDSGPQSSCSPSLMAPQGVS